MTVNQIMLSTGSPGASSLLCACMSSCMEAELRPTSRPLQIVRAWESRQWSVGWANSAEPSWQSWLRSSCFFSPHPLLTLISSKLHSQRAGDFRTPTNQVLESRRKDLKTLFEFFSQRKDSNPRNRTSFCTSSFFVFLRGRFCKFFWFNRTSKFGAVEGVRWENRPANRPASRQTGLEMPCCPANDLLWVQITQSYPDRLRFSSLPCPQSPCHALTC
jgi:hypothetical protein